MCEALGSIPNAAKKGSNSPQNKSNPKSSPYCPQLKVKLILRSEIRMPTAFLQKLWNYLPSPPNP